MRIVNRMLDGAITVGLGICGVAVIYFMIYFVWFTI